MGIGKKDKQIRVLASVDEQMVYGDGREIKKEDGGGWNFFKR